MKKRFPPFLAGALTALVLTALCTTALAASGRLSYNFANVSLNGETRITAGADLPVGDGKYIPGSILYIDETGGKTNYLPVRTIAELLDVEVGYDSATRTVLLNTKGSQPAETETGGLWKVSAKEGSLTFQCEAEDTKHDGPPAYLPASLPEGWSLEETRSIGGGSSAAWVLRTGSGGSVRFCCSYPGKSTFSEGTFDDPAAALKSRRQVTVQGRAADLYTGKSGRESCSLLAWENGEGIFFYLMSRDADQEALLQAAESIGPRPVQAAAWRLGWLPEGSTDFESAVLGDTVQEVRLVKGTNVNLLVSPLPLAVQEEGPGEAVKVRSRAARFWAAQEPMTPREMETQTVGGVVITSGVVSGFGAADMNTLLWTDPDTGVNFRLLSGLDKDTMLRIAENVGR